MSAIRNHFHPYPVKAGTNFGACSFILGDYVLCAKAHAPTVIRTRHIVLMNQLPTMLTTSETADYIRQALGIDHLPNQPERPLDADFISDECRSGRFPHAKQEKPGTPWQISLTDIEAWVEQNRPIPLTPPTAWQRALKYLLAALAIISTPLLGYIIIWVAFFDSLLGPSQWLWETWIATPTPTATITATPPH